jgi:hypothetical protein
MAPKAIVGMRDGPKLFGSVVIIIKPGHERPHYCR